MFSCKMVVRKRPAYGLIAVILSCCLLGGCQTPKQKPATPTPTRYNCNALSSEIEYADVRQCSLSETPYSLPPRTLDDAAPAEFWDMSYEEALSIALANGSALKDLGVRVLRSPEGVATVFDPAIRQSDPIFGPEGALSEFDTRASTGLFWEKSDRAVNNAILQGNVPGGVPFQLSGDVATYRSELSKVAATGTRFSLRNLTVYDESNQDGNFFPSAWDSQLEANVRHPLLQGGGITFNRIAGPDAAPGFNYSSGVLIARVRTDISLADFEMAVRDFVSQFEDAYWDLYFAYRDLDAKTLARDGALETWRNVQAKFARKLRGGEADKEAQAREQFYLFDSLVNDALSGSPIGGQSVGIYRGERRLRRMMGLLSNDGRMIRPADEPSSGRVIFEWEQALAEALVSRAELRRQNWQIKRRELELIAARNFTLPRLDAVGMYRFRGFGDQLTGDGSRFASAMKDLGSGDHQEWRLGLELDVPIGFRQAWAGVRNAELQIAREKAILREQELAISHALGDAIAELARAHNAVKVNFNRLNAAAQRRNATVAAYRGDQVSLDVLLDAQQRLSNAQSVYFQSLAQHAKAIKNVHLEKGGLLQSNGIQLSEGRWPQQAYRDAAKLRRRWRPKLIDYRAVRPQVISHGASPRNHPQVSTPEPEVNVTPIPPPIQDPMPVAPAPDSHPIPYLTEPGLINDDSTPAAQDRATYPDVESELRG